MNKLLVSGIIDLSMGEYNLNCKNTNLTINAKENVVIYLVNSKLENLQINALENSIVKVYLFNNNITNNLDIVINQNNKSSIDLNLAYINNNDFYLNVNNNIIGNNNNSKIVIRNISNKGISKGIINVYIAKNTNNNIAIEDLKGINNGGMVHIEPNIVCYSNEVEANHLTTIGCVDKDALAYLMSKGIPLDTAKKLLLKGFIYSNMDEYIKSLEVI